MRPTENVHWAWAIRHQGDFRQCARARSYLYFWPLEIACVKALKPLLFRWVLAWE